MDHLRAVVVAGVPCVGRGMQPGPGATGEPLASARRADFDGNPERTRRGQQLAGGAARIPHSGLLHHGVHDESLGREPRKDRRDCGEVIDVRVAHDDRLEPAHARGTQGWRRGADPE